MEPVIKMMRNIMNNNIEAVLKMTSALGITLDSKEREYSGKTLVRTVFMKWLNAADIISEMVIKKLPSPKVAQQYRTSTLYEGPQDD